MTVTGPLIRLLRNPPRLLHRETHMTHTISHRRATFTRTPTHHHRPHLITRLIILLRRFPRLSLLLHNIVPLTHLPLLDSIPHKRHLAIDRWWRPMSVYQQCQSPQQLLQDQKFPMLMIHLFHLWRDPNVWFHVVD